MSGPDKPNEVTAEKQAEYGKLRDAYEKKMGDVKKFPDEFLAKYEKEKPAEYITLKALIENEAVQKQDVTLNVFLKSLEKSQDQWSAEKATEVLVFQTTVQAERPAVEAMLALLSVSEKQGQVPELRANFEKAINSNNPAELQTAYQAVIDANNGIQPTIVEKEFDGKTFKGELKDGLPYNGEYRWSENGQDYHAKVEDGFISESEVGAYDSSSHQLVSGSRFTQQGDGDYKIEQGVFNPQLGQIETGVRETYFNGNTSIQTGSFAQVDPESNNVQLQNGMYLRNGQPELVSNGETHRFNEAGVQIDESKVGKPLSESEALAAGLTYVGSDGQTYASDGYQWMDENDENNYGVVLVPAPTEEAETGSAAASSQPDKQSTSVDATTLEKSFVSKLKEKPADYVTHETKDGKTTVTLTDKVPDRGSRIHHIVGPTGSGAAVEISEEDMPKTLLSAKGVDYKWNGETWADPDGKRLLIGPSYNQSFEISKKEAEPSPVIEPAPLAEPVTAPVEATTEAPEAEAKLKDTITEASTRASFDLLAKIFHTAQPNKTIADLTGSVAGAFKGAFGEGVQVRLGAFQTENGRVTLRYATKVGDLAQTHRLDFMSDRRTKKPDGLGAILPDKKSFDVTLPTLAFEAQANGDQKAKVEDKNYTYEVKTDSINGEALKELLAKMQSDPTGALVHPEIV